MRRGEKELWRVANASADTIVDLQLQYDGEPQRLGVVAFDGVPTGSQNGTRRGRVINATDILLPPAARAELIVDGPSASVRTASLVTLAVNTGPGGDNDPARPLATIEALGRGKLALPGIPNIAGQPWRQRFEGLATTAATIQCKLYFSEVLSDPNNPLSPTTFFITVDGDSPAASIPTIRPRSSQLREAWKTGRLRTGAWKAMSSISIRSTSWCCRKTISRSTVVNPTKASWANTYMIQVPYWDGNPCPSLSKRHFAH